MFCNVKKILMMIIAIKKELIAVWRDLALIKWKTIFWNIFERCEYFNEIYEQDLLK